MIDLGLTKLAVIGVVALIVIGPEKLPRVARMAGTLYGRAQRYLNDIKSEVSREIELEELKSLHKTVQEAAHNIKSDVENSISQNISPLAKRTNWGLTNGTSKKSDIWFASDGFEEPETNTIRFTRSSLKKI